MSDQTQTEDIQEETPDAVEAEARGLGWVPEEDFKGPKDRWVSAEDFVEKGKHILPILSENNKRLKAELLTRDAKIANLETSMADSQKAIDAMKKHFTAATKAQVAAAKKDLVESIKLARDSGDVDAELALMEQLDTVRTDEKAATADQKDTPPEKKDNKAVEIAPDILSWGEDNPWYGKDKKRSKAMDRTAEDLRDAGEISTGREFLEKAYALMESRIEFMEEFNKVGKTASKVESGAPGRGGATGAGAKSFASLPAEAKKACHEDNDVLVGKGKRYATVGDWEKEFAKIYYGME